MRTLRNEMVRVFAGLCNPVKHLAELTCVGEFAARGSGPNPAYSHGITAEFFRTGHEL